MVSDDDSIETERIIMSAPIDSLDLEGRRIRWRVLETRFEAAELAVATHLAEMQAFACRCLEVDAYRARRPQRYRIMGVLVEVR